MRRRIRRLERRSTCLASGPPNATGMRRMGLRGRLTRRGAGGARSVPRALRSYRRSSVAFQFALVSFTGSFAACQMCHVIGVDLDSGALTAASGIPGAWMETGSGAGAGFASRNRKHLRLRRAVGNRRTVSVPRSNFTPAAALFRHCLKKRRIAAGLTQRSLAARLNRPQSFVAKYESGERRIDVVEYLEIAKAVGFDPSELIRELR